MNYFMIPGLQKMDVLGLSPTEREKQFTMVFADVCSMYDVTVKEAQKNNKNRTYPFAEIRQISMVIFINRLKSSTNDAAAYFGKDHATAIHAKKVVSDRYRFDKQFRLKTEPILESINL